VVPVFLRQKQSGEVTITDERMTRFVITLDQGVQFVLDSLARMQGGEIFVPKIPSVRINDIAEAIAPGCTRKYVGIRPGEKLHEVMVAEDDARNTLEFAEHFAILPDGAAMENPLFTQNGLAKRCPEDFRYSSDRNDVWVNAAGFDSLWANEQTSEAQSL
jgi:UDP-N-acetylglucosamine 4,6-dehydratase